MLTSKLNVPDANDFLELGAAIKETNSRKLIPPLIAQTLLPAAKNCNLSSSYDLL